MKIKTAMLLFIIKEQQSAFLLSIIQLHRENSGRAHVQVHKLILPAPTSCDLHKCILATKTPSESLYSSLWNILKAWRNITDRVSLLILFHDKLFLSDISASDQQCLSSYQESLDYSQDNIRHILKCFAESVQHLFWMFAFKKRSENNSMAQWVIFFFFGWGGNHKYFGVPLSSQVFPSENDQSPI